MKIRATKQHDKDTGYKGIDVKCPYDGGELKDVMDAISKIRDLKFIAEAFKQENVTASARIGYRYKYLGKVCEKMYIAYLNYFDVEKLKKYTNYRNILTLTEKSKELRSK